MELTFGEMLHIQLRRNKMTCVELANKLGISRQMAAYYTLDTAIPYDATRVKELAKAVDMEGADADELMDAYKKSLHEKQIPADVSKRKMWDMCVEKDKRIQQLERELKRLKG